MKDYKKMWDNLYKYIQKWNDSIDLERDLKVYTNTELDMVRSLTRRYTLSTILDEMMDIEVDAKETEQVYNTLIKCEDCMHYVPGAYNKNIGVCKKFGLKPLGEWYCASGVRRVKKVDL